MAEKTTLVKKHLIRPFLNKGTSESPEWIQIKKATDYSRSMNPVTEERDFIADEQASTVITGYKPSEPLTVTMFKGEKDFDLFYDLYKKRAIGSDAEKEFLLVYLFDSKEVGGKTYYYADKTMASITVDELNAVDSTLSITVYENGTPDKGYVEIVDGVPAFTKGEFPEE